MNPVLPLNHFVPDPEARVWSQQPGESLRLYVYGSYDVSGDTFYCSREYHTFSTSDLIVWKHHGVSFSTDEAVARTEDQPPAGGEWADETLFAPDCIERDGVFYLFFCTATNGEGIATSKSPAGPFTDPRPVLGAHGDAIDPSVFIDDDGQAYLYWGQFHCRAARLTDELNAIDPDTLKPDLITEELHGFHEGPSMRKHNGVYYLVYSDISRGRPTCLSYATSEHPLGPFEKRGVIVDNSGCDPESWNNHGSICQMNGQWYVFYHRSSQASRYSRRLCIEKIEIDRSGMIAEVEMTTQGPEDSLDPFRWMEASRACHLSGTVRALPCSCVDPRCQGDTDYPGEVLGFISDGDAIAYRYFDFSSSPSSFELEASSQSYGGSVEVRIDSTDGPVIGTLNVQRTGSWHTFESHTCTVDPVNGVHAVWLTFTGRQGRLMDLLRFRFNP
jgi:hypothetical protein